MKALLLGSISVLADTSELQRAAFNDAFHEAGLDWYWSRDEYRRMLENSGGKGRIAEFSDRCGEKVDTQALHAHKTEIFQDMLRSQPLELRPYVAQALADARDQGVKIGLISGTARKSLEALLDRFGGISALGIDLVTSADDGLAAKPDPALYTHALKVLDIAAHEAIAVEDNVPGLKAAQAAGLTCYAYPNENTMLHDFGDAPHIESLMTSHAA